MSAMQTLLESTSGSLSRSISNAEIKAASAPIHPLKSEKPVVKVQLSAPSYFHSLSENETPPFKKPEREARPHLLIGSIMNEDEAIEMIAAADADKARGLKEFLVGKLMYLRRAMEGISRLGGMDLRRITRPCNKPPTCINNTVLRVILFCTFATDSMILTTLVDADCTYTGGITQRCRPTSKDTNETSHTSVCSYKLKNNVSSEFLVLKKVIQNYNVSEKSFLISFLTETIDYAAQRDFNAFKLACLLTIYLNTHMHNKWYFWQSPVNLWNYFKEIMIRHTIEDSPDGQEVFEPEECYDIMSHFHAMYLTNLPLVHILSFGAYRLKFHWPFKFKL